MVLEFDTFSRPSPIMLNFQQILCHFFYYFMFSLTLFVSEKSSLTIGLILEDSGTYSRKFTKAPYHMSELTVADN